MVIFGFLDHSFKVNEIIEDLNKEFKLKIKRNQIQYLIWKNY